MAPLRQPQVLQIRTGHISHAITTTSIGDWSTSDQGAQVFSLSEKFGVANAALLLVLHLRCRLDAEFGARS